jgi:hypothetical protein
MTTLTPERLADIEKRCEKLVPGPWIVDADPDRSDQLAVRGIDVNGWWIAGACVGIWHDMGGEAHAQFIAHARTDIPDLLNEIKRLREEVSNGHEAVFTINEALAAAKSNGQLWEEDMVGLCKHFGVEITVDNIDNAADQVIEIHDQLRAQLSDAQAALKVKDRMEAMLVKYRDGIWQADDCGDVLVCPECEIILEGPHGKSNHKPDCKLYELTAALQPGSHDEVLAELDKKYQPHIDALRDSTKLRGEDMQARVGSALQPGRE